MDDPPLFPLFLKLSGRKVLVVGGGAVAASKIGPLRAAGARVQVVAPDVTDSLAAMRVKIERREYTPSDLRDVWLVVAAATPEVNRRVAEDSAACQLFVNAVDDPKNASAYLGGVVRRAGVTFAISTDGKAPALAGLIREGLDAVLPEDELDAWMTEAERLRATWKADKVPMGVRRPALLQALVKLKRYD